MIPEDLHVVERGLMKGQQIPCDEPDMGIDPLQPAEQRRRQVISQLAYSARDS